MPKQANSILMVSAAVVLVSCWGCGGSTDPAAPVSTVPVKGTVTYQGKPLTGGTIKFEPEGAGREAYGQIKPDGTYVLSTYKPDDGAVLGPHRRRRRRRQQRHAERDPTSGWRSLDRPHKLSRKILN